MVLLHVKILEKSQFWYKASPTDKVPDVIHQIVLIYNDRIKLSHILTGNCTCKIKLISDDNWFRFLLSCPEGKR